jgi:hypothetical protein
MDSNNEVVMFPFTTKNDELVIRAKWYFSQGLFIIIILIGVKLVF